VRGTTLDTKYEADSVSKVYAECDNISIDYGLMERADNVCVITTVMGWSDLGNWGAVYELSDKDDNGNALIGANILAQHCKNCLIVNASEEQGTSGKRVGRKICRAN